MIESISKLWATHKAWIVVGALVIYSSVLVAARYTNKTPSVPTLVLKRGDFIDSLQFRGEVKALKSISIDVPNDAGDFQILKIAQDGSSIKQGDVIAEFDKTSTEQNLAQYRTGLKSAQAEIEQARAQARLTEEDDRTAVMKAQFDVDSAKLDVSKQEVVSKIEGGEAKLKLADAEQKLVEVKQTLQSDRISSKSTIDSTIKASEKAAYDVQRAEHALGGMEIKSPLTGMISLVSVWHGNSASPFKPGDKAWPGAPLAEIPDISTLRISARVEETERSRLALQQPATVHMDAISDRDFTGKLEQISTIATSDFTGGWPFPRNFDLKIALDQQDPRLKPGMTAQVTVVVEKIPDALAIPVQASFQKSGQTVAYIWSGSKFEERAIEIGRRSGDRILILNGLSPDDRVALADPTTKE
ncbi:MAG TPA: efflux RND transporter periplasmic adaptor subunit [Terriglobales bacterium]|jgi:RND family efflux transporter MFP subunit